MKQVLTYLCIFGFMVLIMAMLPHPVDLFISPRVVIPVAALLFTLLVGLSAKLAGTGGRPENIFGTAVFILLFMPDVGKFYTCDDAAILELGSQCIVPFFLLQYDRVRKRPFTGWHFLMLLMGIFCSYTHDGITIPLCAGFLWVSFLNRSTFFRTACWPMVVGFVIGTGLSIWQAMDKGTSGAISDFEGYTSQTTRALALLWDTKIFLVTVGLTAYLSVSRWGRQILVQNFRDYTLLSCCAMLSYCALPFAPLGLDNAVTGVCFFCMFWALLLLRSLADKFYYARGKKVE